MCDANNYISMDVDCYNTVPVVTLVFVGGLSPWLKWPAVGAPSHKDWRNTAQLSP